MDGDPALSRDGGEGAWILPAFLLAGALAAAGVFPDHGLWFVDEPRVAGIGREMFDKGSLFLPLLGGRPFLEKPPLYWWAQMGSFALFGVHTWSARLPSLLFNLLASWGAWAMGRKLAGGKGGFLAVGVLGTILLYSSVMHRCLVDPALVFTLAWAHYGLLCLHSPDSPGEKKRGALLVSLFLALAFLAKGFVGVGLGAGPFILYLFLRKRFREILSLRSLLISAVPAFLVLVLPWAWGLYRQGGAEALKECLLGNTFGRLLGTTTKYGHLHPPFYYLGSVLGRFLPWTLALPALAAFPPSREDSRRREIHFTLLGMVGLGILLLSLASSKRSLYLTPLLPALSALLGAWLVRAEGSGRVLDRLTLGALALPAVFLPAAAYLFILLCPLLPGGSPYLSRCREAAGPLVLVPAGGAVLVWTLLPARRLWLSLRRGAAPAAASLVLSLAGLFLAGQALAPPLLDPLKSAHPVSRAVARVLEEGGECALFLPKEALRGLLYFDLGRVLPEIPAEETVSWFGERKGPRYLLVEKRRLSHLPAAARAASLPVWESRGRKPFILLKNRN